MSIYFSRFEDRARHSSWLVWLIGVGVYVLAVFHRASLGVAGPDAIARLEISSTALGTFVMVQLGIYALMQVPFGLAIDRWGPRKILLIATLIMGTAQLIFAFATNFPVALLARALLGVGDSAVFISVLRLAAGWFPRRRYAVLTMTTGLAGMAGNLIATVPLVIALGDFGWTRTFAVTGAMSIMYALLLLRPAVSAPYREEEPPPRTAPAAVTSPATPVPPEPAPSALREAGRNIRASWARPETRLGFWTHQATMSAGTVISLVWGFPYLTEGLGYRNEDAAAMLSVYVVANLIANFIIGPLAGRRPRWRTPIALYISLACVLALSLLALWPQGQPPVAAVTISFIVLALGGPASQIGFHLARDYNPTATISTATGLVNAGGFLGAMLAALAVGVVLDLSSGASLPALTGYRWAVGTIAVLGVVSTVTMVLTLLHVRHNILARMADGVDVVVQVREHRWDRAYRRITRSGA